MAAVNSISSTSSSSFSSLFISRSFCNLRTRKTCSISISTSSDRGSSLIITCRKLQREERATVRLFEDNIPSVVYITAELRKHELIEGMLEGRVGSGFVWDKKGHIVTNYHVIQGGTKIRVTLADQTDYYAKLVGFDPDKDLAVLHISVRKKKLRPIRLGVSANLRVGQKVFAIGSPFQLDQTLTTGVISGLKREITSSVTERLIQDVIQTDAVINPGNSGGPLLDSSGRIIGVNTCGYSECPYCTSTGVNFSIPIDTVVGIVTELLLFGNVARPMLGIKFSADQWKEQPRVRGVIVFDAPLNGPAGKAGMRSAKFGVFGILILGDIITSLNGKEVANGNDLYKILDQCNVGETVTVKVLRGNHVVKIHVVLEPKSDET